MMTVFDEMCYATSLVNKIHKTPHFLITFFSFLFLNLGLVFYPSKLFVPNGGSLPGEALLLPSGWQCIWKVINHSVISRKIRNASAPTGDNIML